jgi:hypothetical protein
LILLLLARPRWSRPYLYVRLILEREVVSSLVQKPEPALAVDGPRRHLLPDAATHNECCADEECDQQQDKKRGSATRAASSWACRVGWRKVYASVAAAPAPRTKTAATRNLNKRRWR